jgi:class 3 adenylate cyclase
VLRQNLHVVRVHVPVPSHPLAAARLEQANKQFGTGTMVSETTRQQAGEGEFAYRSLGEIQVKGRQASVQVYELLPITPATPAHPPGAL